jgi:hypothetical protein
VIFLAGSCIALLGFLVIWQSYVSARERDKLLADFSSEREIWVRERRDLNNRIQIPEAAPFMADEDGSSEDDLPTLPGFTMNEEERERAMQELEEVGYSEGPVA